MNNNVVQIFYGGFLGKTGGAFMHASTIARELEKMKYHVEIITLDKLPFFVRYFPHLIQLLINLVFPPLGYYYKDRLTRRLYKLFFVSEVSLRIFEDVYLSWDSDIPSLTILHAVWSDNIQALPVSKKQHDRLVCREANVIKKICHPIVTVSEPYLNYLKSVHFSEHQMPDIHVVPLGLDLDSFEKLNKKEQILNTFVYCGTLEARKNVQFLLNVFEMLLTYNSKFKLTIIGDGPDRKKLTEFVNEKKLPVNFLGRLNHDQVIKELSKHEYFLHPSIKESFSFALLEAKLVGLKTCAFKGLEVPKEFIDIPMSSFEVEEWCRGIVSNDIEESHFDSSRFSSHAMAEETLNLVPSFFERSVEVEKS